MKSLRNRIAALLILAIVSVVGLATLAATQALHPPLQEATMDPTAKQFQLLIALVDNDRDAAVTKGVILTNQPASGLEDEWLSHYLMSSLSRTGAARQAIVTKSPDSPALTASVNLGGTDWMIMEMPDLRPPADGWKVFAGWVVLIVIGSAAISIYAAAKITGPLGLIEEAVGRIGEDGVLPPIPETGSNELRTTARALNRLSSRLKSAMESRMRLVAAAGHDLRTPMTRMRLRAEFVTDEEERGKWFADLEELDSIADSAIRLVREEASQDPAESASLDALLREIVEELNQLNLDVTATELKPVRVPAGPVALKRALRNLVINAATHGKGANISLARKDDKAVVTITDEGPGIPEEQLAQVFEPFFRVDPARRKTVPGAGLGLAIAKEIVERFGGRISIANRTPIGLVQTVRLPLVSAS